MSRPLALRLGLVIIVVIFLTGLGGLTAYYADLPSHVSQHETIILGQNRFVPGSQAALRVVVRDSKDASPLANAAVKILLRPAAGGSAQTLFTGNTDSQGTANVSFTVPTNGDVNQTLIVETRSSLGSDRVERAVTLDRDYRVLLTTDKPLYQPGQIIHLRALALSAFDLHPAVGQDLEIIIADGKGNKVFRETLKTSDYGVASTDFQLATQVNTGPYKITAQLGNTSSEKTVTVEHYVLPKFTVKLDTENSFYLPGAHVRGSLQSDYFFGKPVAGGQVVLEGYTFDVARTSAFKLQGTTDAAGAFQFEFDLPTFIAGTDLEGGRGLFFLQATVTDLAQHTETSNLSLPIAQSQLVIEAVPEGGQFRPGVENIFYVLTSYPDGTPAETGLRLNFANTGQTLEAQTGPYGLAEVRLTPDAPYEQIGIDAKDTRGATAHQDFSFQGEYAEETILLRPDKPLYRIGETMNLTILTSQAQGTAYLDIVREGQTVSTRAIPVDGGHAEVAVDLTPDLYGTLELHAYKILTSGNITRDTRLVVVEAATDLNLTITPDHPVYRPGDSAGLDIQVNGQDGNGAQSAVGLAVVDESVFALAEQDPGFAKLYFLLEQELLEPKYELHGFSVPELLKQEPPSDPALRGAQAGAAQASLAQAISAGGKLSSPVFTLQANSHQDAIQRSYDAQQKYFTNMSRGLYGLLLLLPLMVMGLSAYAVARERQLIRSFLLIATLVSVAFVLFLIWPLGENYGWAQTPLDRLSAITDWLTQQGESVVLGLALLGLLGFLALSVIALLRKERALGWSLALLVLFVPVAGFLAFTASQANVYPSTAVIGWGLAAFALMPAAFLLRAASFGWNRRIVLAFLTLLVSLSIAVDTFPLMAEATGTGAVPALRRDLRLEADGGLGGGAIEEFAVADAMPAATQAAQVPASPPDEQAGAGKTSTGQQPEPPRLRQYFPETMLWLPDGVTDAAGLLHVNAPVADSITTWRVTALASTQDGRLGSTTGSLRVFQDFFIDLDLPGSLTVGDEVSVPVGVFNYLPNSQTVRLELEKADWFDLLDESSKEINIAANDISVVYFKIRAKNFGNQPFKVTALGSQMSDAIQKNVRVFPDGKQIFFTQSDRLTVGTPVKASATIPVDAIPGTQSLTVKIYPGIVSQVVEGLDSMLQMPSGCFEQTSSTNYPNTLVLDYLKSTNQVSPETQLKAEEYINLGYQRLTTFEVNGSGGFSLFGEPPADPMLTAYGLQEFSDMSRVHPVDAALIQRAADWLLSQQQADGSWAGLEGFHESTLTNQTEHLPVTAYIVWSLVDSGFGDDARVEKGLQYLHEFQGQSQDAYVVALVANALVAADVKNNPSAGSGQAGNLSSSTEAVLDRLAGMAVKNGNEVTWHSSNPTFMGSEGQTGDLETTALAALAFLRANSHPDLANAALTTLIKQKDSFGTWYNTQATILTLKALLQSVRAGAENVNAKVTVTLNGGQSKTVQVTPENFDVVQLLTFSDVLPGAENVVGINVEGKGNLMYQVSGNYYLPWDKLALYPEQVKDEELVKIDVAYDRTELVVNEEVNVNVVVTMNKTDGQAEWALIDLGVPPGFEVESADLDGLVTRFKDVPADYALPTIERYELTGRQILVYIKNLSGGNPLKFSYRLKAKYPLVAQTPASMAYDYYNPNVSGESVPQVLTVKS